MMTVSNWLRHLPIRSDEVRSHCIRSTFDLRSKSSTFWAQISSASSSTSKPMQNLGQNHKRVFKMSVKLLVSVILHKQEKDLIAQIWYESNQNYSFSKVGK